MKNQTTRTMALVRMALLVAVELIMAVTPLGYLRTAGLEISFLMVPVALGGILLGPLAGAVLGGVFGVSSFLAAFSSAFGAPLLALNPFYTFVVCFVPRVLAGWLPGLLVRVMTKNPQKSKLPAFAAASLAAPVLNTVLFMAALLLFFYNSQPLQAIATALGTSNVIAFFGAFVGVQGLIEAGVCFAICLPLSVALNKVIKTDPN